MVSLCVEIPKLAILITVINPEFPALAPEPPSKPAPPTALDARVALVLEAARRGAEVLRRHPGHAVDFLRRQPRVLCDARAIGKKPLAQITIGQQTRQETLDVGLHGLLKHAAGSG